MPLAPDLMLPVFPVSGSSSEARTNNHHLDRDPLLTQQFENGGHRGQEDGMDTESTKSSDPGSSRDGEDVARVIGNIPIAMYEGSPRRYGLKQQPGHPQRILPLAEPASGHRIQVNGKLSEPKSGQEPGHSINKNSEETSSFEANDMDLNADDCEEEAESVVRYSDRDELPKSSTD